MRDDNHLAALDGMRGFAAIAVVVRHLQFITMSDVVPGGYLAVDFFFGLSGFVLALAAERWLAARVGIWGMVRKRIVRLYPMLAVGTALGTAQRLLNSAHNLNGVIFTLRHSIPGFLCLPVPSRYSPSTTSSRS